MKRPTDQPIPSPADRLCPEYCTSPYHHVIDAPAVLYNMHIACITYNYTTPGARMGAIGGVGEMLANPSVRVGVR